MIQLHELKPIHKLKKQKRVGRGGKRGAYSGRGIKGQRARAGWKFKPIIRELIKKYPKLRGYRQKLAPYRTRGSGAGSKIVIVNLEILEKRFNSGEKITPEILLERRIIRKIKGRTPLVKILGVTLSPGKITKALMIEGCQISKSAKEKIEKAGGVIK